MKHFVIYLLHHRMGCLHYIYSYFAIADFFISNISVKIQTQPNFEIIYSINFKYVNNYIFNTFFKSSKSYKSISNPSIFLKLDIELLLHFTCLNH